VAAGDVGGDDGAGGARPVEERENDDDSVFHEVGFAALPWLWPHRSVLRGPLFTNQTRCTLQCFFPGTTELASVDRCFTRPKHSLRPGERGGGGSVYAVNVLVR
jgi:hypothetical protein